MPERKFSVTSDGYRFGFNTQEKTDEIAGAGNHNTELFWEYDTRLGRRWNLDPKPVTEFSNYSVFLCNPIILSDVLGDTVLINLFNKNEDRCFKPAENMVLNKENYKDGIFIIADSQKDFQRHYHSMLL